MLILASKSETRASMLKNAGVSFDIQPAMADEEAIKNSLLSENISARDMADCLADAKARSLAFSHQGYILGADQILECEGKIFSKVSNMFDAKDKLKALSGKTHTLYSAAVIYEGCNPIWRSVDKATLKMRVLSNDFIENYLDMIGDAAFWSVGCYQVEGVGLQLFEKIEGSHFTILGLPMIELLDFLRRVDIIRT
jgi:septum formation protein